MVLEALNLLERNKQSKKHLPREQYLSFPPSPASRMPIPSLFISTVSARSSCPYTFLDWLGRSAVQLEIIIILWNIRYRFSLFDSGALEDKKRHSWL